MDKAGKSPRAIVVDIEGTVCPISFVRDSLFPYFLEELPGRLEAYDFPLSHAQGDVVHDALMQFPAAARESRAALLAYIRDLVARDVKDPALKNLQGLVWEQGYTSGAILAPLFADAITALINWHSAGIPLYVYSSGSVKAQKMLFANVQGPQGKLDLNYCFKDYFDTVNAGNKTQAGSYQRIADAIGLDPALCLFLSDNVKEVEAATQAGWRAVVVVRPGNAEVGQHGYEEVCTLNGLP